MRRPCSIWVTCTNKVWAWAKTSIWPNDATIWLRKLARMPKFPSLWPYSSWICCSTWKLSEMYVTFDFFEKGFCYWFFLEPCCQVDWLCRNVGIRLGFVLNHDANGTAGGYYLLQTAANTTGARMTFDISILVCLFRTDKLVKKSGSVVYIFKRQ